MKIDHYKVQGILWGIGVVACFVLAFILYVCFCGFLDYKDAKKSYKSKETHYLGIERNLNKELSDYMEEYNNLKNKDTVIIENKIVTIYEDEDLAYLNE